MAIWSFFCQHSRHGFHHRKTESHRNIHKFDLPEWFQSKKPVVMFRCHPVSDRLGCACLGLLSFPIIAQTVRQAWEALENLAISFEATSRIRPSHAIKKHPMCFPEKWYCTCPIAGWCWVLFPYIDNAQVSQVMLDPQVKMGMFNTKTY